MAFIKKYQEPLGYISAWLAITVVLNVTGYYILRYAVTNGVLNAVVILKDLAA
jgi:hypothetical protein